MRRYLHKGCDETEVADFSYDDDLSRQQDPDDTLIPPSPSFVPFTGEDGPSRFPSPTLNPSPQPDQSKSNDSDSDSVHLSPSPTTSPSHMFETLTPSTVPASIEPIAPTSMPVDLGPTPTNVIMSDTDAPSSIRTPPPSGLPVGHDSTVAPSIPRPSDTPTPYGNIADDDTTVVDDDTDLPNDTNDDVLEIDDDSTDQEGTVDDDQASDDVDQSISNEGTNRNGNGSFIPVDLDVGVDTSAPFDLDAEITNEDFVSPTNAD